MVSSADAVQQQQGPPSGQARTQHSSSDHSSCTLPDPTANGSGSPVTSWVNTGLSSPSPFEVANAACMPVHVACMRCRPSQPDFWAWQSYLQACAMVMAKGRC